MDKLIISKFYKDTLLGFHLIDDKVEMIYDFSDSEVGNVYCGIVKDVTKNLSSAFVEFGEDKKGFLSFDGNLKSGDKVLVQVKADKIKTKDYLLTTKLCLSEDDIAEVERKFEFASPKSCLFRTDYMINTCKELSQNGTEILTDDDIVYHNLEGAKILVLLYNTNDSVSIENKFKLGKIISDVLSPKVWMKSGAYLLIEHTEAMTVIDVNSGKNISKNDREDNIKKINFEAADYIIEHLRLRNISGIIIVDFINMGKDDYDELLDYMKELAKTDFELCNVIGYTELGLMEITRKKNRKPLREVFGEVVND